MANGRPEKKSNLWKWLLGCGCLILLAGGLFIGGIVWYISASFTQDPVKAKEIASTIVKFDVPEGYKMLFAGAPPFVGLKFAGWGQGVNQQNQMNGMLMLFPKSMGTNQAQMEAQMSTQSKQGAGGQQMTVKSTEDVPITVAGEAVTAVKKNMVSQNGGAQIQYMFFLTRPNGTVMIMVQGPADTFDEAAWESFVASIQ